MISRRGGSPWISVTPSAAAQVRTGAILPVDTRQITNHPQKLHVLRGQRFAAKKICDLDFSSSAAGGTIRFVHNKDAAGMGPTKPPAVTIRTLINAPLVQEISPGMLSEHISSWTMTSLYPLIRPRKEMSARLRRMMTFFFTTRYDGARKATGVELPDADEKPWWPQAIGSKRPAMSSSRGSNGNWKWPMTR